MPRPHPSLSDQEIVERIEWPLLDCIQEFHFSYNPYGCDVADYRVRFGHELSHQRGRMHQLHMNELNFLPLISDRELLLHAPRYRVLQTLLSAAQPGFGAAARFAAALTRNAESGRLLDEEIFALIAVGHDGNDGVAIGLMKEANALLSQAGLPRIELLFLVAAETQSRICEGQRQEFSKDLDQMEKVHSKLHRIAETFEFNKMAHVPHASRCKHLCKALVVRIPAA
jgi:hypothetical protein